MTGTNLAVVVELDIHDGHLDRFLGLIRENAAASMDDEAGCLRFDVMVPSDGEAETPHVVLYELYVDAAAFDDHLRRAHFMAFDAATLSMVASKRVKRFDIVG